MTNIDYTKISDPTAVTTYRLAAAAHQNLTTAPDPRDYADPIVFSLAYNAWRAPVTRHAHTAPAVLANDTKVTVTYGASFTRGNVDYTDEETVVGTKVRNDGQRIYAVRDAYRVTRWVLASQVSAS